MATRTDQPDDDDAAPQAAPGSADPAARIAAERPLLARSLWTALGPPPPACPPLQGDARADVCVVGGGYAGLSAALHLAQAGASVRLLEARHPGWGASGRNGGQVIAGLKLDPAALRARLGPAADRLIRLSATAPDLVWSLIDRHAIACDDTRAGWLQPAHDAATDRRQAARARALAAEGAPVAHLSAAETAAATGAQGFTGALLDNRGGSVQPLAYALGLARAAQAAGAVLHGASAVTAITRAAAGWTLRTAQGTVTADRVILALNAHADAAADDLRRSIVPVISVQIASSPLSPNLRATVLTGGRTASELRRLPVYWRLSPDGRLVIGGRGAASDAGLRAAIARLKARAAALHPQLGPLDWPFHWGGPVAITPDALPHLHEPAPGLTAALGWNGRGVAMATAAGRVLADRALGRAGGDDLPASPLRPIPFHALRGPGVAAAVAWKGLLDRLGV